MAEEVNTSEQEQTPQPTLPTVQQDNQPDVSFLQYLPESIKTPARPSAASIYSKYVGNPLTGSDPGERFTSSGQPRVDPMQAAATKSLAYENKYAALKPFTYSGDFDKARFERYYSAKDAYNKLGFNPYANNEDLYNKNMTFGDRFVRAAGQWDNLIASGFMSGVRSWKTIFTDPLAPDVEGARDMERIMQEGADTTGGIGAFFNNTFLNSGYTVGIGLNFLGEELALMGATALSEGTLSGVTLPAMVARTGSALNKMFEGSKIIGGALKNLTRMDGVRAINSIPEARSFWSTVGKGAKTAGKGVFEMVNPLENTYQALKATDYATDFAKMSKTFGAFADDILMMKNVVAEAKIEGGLVKINATKELIDLYVAQNDRQPEGKALQEIEEIASKEAYRTAALNLPAIGVTNKLMYATMLAPLRNVMGKQAVPLLEDIIFNKKTFTSLGEGLLDKGSAALKSLAKPKFYGQFGMNYLTANLAEGVQENLQEAISYGAVAHAKAMYTNPIRAAHDGYMSDLKEGLKQQFSRQGAETFASGFLMGAFAQPIMAIPSMGISKLVRSFNTEQYEAAKQTRKNAIQKEVNILNEQYKSPLDFYAPDLGNAVKTGSLADDMYSAGRVGNKKEAMDAQAAIQNQHMITAFKTGKYDIIRKRLADYENFTAEETVEAFKKYGIEEKDYEKASAKIKEVIARADRIKEIYENVAKKYPNPINVSNYKRGTPERVNAELFQIAWDEAVKNLIFAHATMDSHSKRIADIAKTFSAISNDMAGEDAQSLMSMLSTTTLAKEVVALANEVKVLDDNIPAQKKIKAKKEKQLEKIDKYFSAIKDIEEAKTPEEKAKAEEKAKDAFGDYVKFLANKNEKLIFDDSLEDAYNMVRDSMLLKNDMKSLVDSINVLMTPQNFLNLHARLYNAHEEMFKNKETIINNNVNLHHEIKDTNDAINLIYQENKLSLSPESLDAIKEAKNKNENLPANITFVDEDGNAVTSGPRFENAMKTWKVLLDLTKKEAKPVEEKIEEEETEEEEVEKELQPFDPEDVSTYPDSLMNDLEDMYELYKESSLIDEGDTFDMFLKTQTAKVIIKNAELAVKLQEERKEKKPDLLQRINNAGTPEELDEIDAEIQKAGALTKELIDATNKKRESFKKTTTTPTDIKAKEADIEKRRQEELDLIKPHQEKIDELEYLLSLNKGTTANEIMHTVLKEGSRNPKTNHLEYTEEGNKISSLVAKLFQTKESFDEKISDIIEEWKQDAIEIKKSRSLNNRSGKINAKYDAELAALKNELETTSTEIKDKKADIERRRQEELKPYKQEYVDSLIKRIKEKSELEKFGMALGLYSEGRYNPIVALNGIGHIKEKGIVTKNTLINAVYNIWGELEGDKFTQFLESEENSSQGLGRSAKEQINAKYDAELKALTQPIASVSDKKAIVAAGIREQGTQVSVEVIGDSGKEFLLVIDRNSKGRVELFSEKKDWGDGTFTYRPGEGEQASQEQKVKLYNKYVPESVRNLITEWQNSFTGSWAAPETEDGKRHRAIEKRLEKELDALEGKPAEKTGIPLTITSQVRQQLYDLGYNKQDVDAMKPEDAKQIIDNQVTKKTTKYKKPRKKKTKDGKQLTIDLEGPENINENYKGAIIYMTPSSIVDLEGYPTVINTDDISIDFIIEQVPNVNLKWYAKTYKNEHNWKAQVIYDAIAHAGVDGNKLREKVSKRAKELAAEGYTVLTGSNYYIKDADYVMIQTNPEINKNMPDYPIQNAIYEAKVENKPVILINQMFNEALKQTPQELSDKDLEFINEDSEITIEDINKKITQKGLYIARDRGYDVFYKNKRYAIVNISGNSVSLSSIDGEKINVKVSEISSVVDPTGGQASKSDISTFKNNENNIQSGKVNIDFEEKNINKVIKDIEDNIC